MKNLKNNILAKIIASVVVSIIILYGLLSISNYVIADENLDLNINFNAEVDKSIELLEDYIVANDVTYDRAYNSEVVGFFSQSVEWLGTEAEVMNNLEDYFYANRNKHIKKVKFADTSAYMLITDKTIESRRTALYIGSSIVSAVAFLCLIIYFILKQSRYFRKIEKGINDIATGKNDSKIMVKGTGDFSRIAIKINQMSDVLNENNRQAKESELQQRKFITNISHDLRTPLTSMIGYLDVVESKLEDNDELHEYVSTAKKNGIRLKKLIDDLFLHSKLLSNDIVFNKTLIDLNVVVLQCIEIRNEKIVFNKSQLPLKIEIDPDYFYRVLNNLINNAIKYGDLKKPIVITSKEEYGYYIISIENVSTIDLTDEMDKIRNRSYTTDKSRHDNSSGLGLSIVTSLLENMDGKLDITYKDNKFIASVILKK